MKKLLALILCVTCLVPLCRPVPAHAVAVVDDAALLAAGGVTLIGSMLVAGGAKFASNDDVQRVAQDIWDRYIVPSAELSAEVTRIVTDWQYAARLGKRAVLNASARLWAAVCSGPVETEISAGRYGVVGGSMTVTLDPDDPADSAFYNISSGKHLFAQKYGRGPNCVSWGGHTYSFVGCYDSSSNTYFIVASVDGVETQRWVTTRAHVVDDPPRFSTSQVYTVDGKVAGRDLYGIVSMPSYAAWPHLHIPYTSFGTVTFSLTGGAEISYPIDSDLIRPGDKSTTVQLPADLPKYGEDGATVEMPVISLDQTDYIIADGDVISSATSEEDVILDAATGERVQADTDVSSPDKPIAGTGVLDWLKGILKGLLDTIIGLLTNIKDGILSIPELIAKAIAAIFVPSDAAVEEVQTTIDAKLPVIADVRSILGNLTHLMEHPDQAASGLALTTVVDLSKHTSGTWGTAKVNLLDASWFIKYKSLTDDIIVGLAWLVFLWRLYGALPNIIHGMSGGGGVVDDC